MSNQENVFMGDSSLLKGQPKLLMIRMLEECHNITSSSVIKKWSGYPGDQQQAREGFTAEQSLPHSCRPLGGHGGGSQGRAEESVTG